VGVYHALQTHEGCFNLLRLHQLQHAWDITVPEAHDAFEIVLRQLNILLPSYCKTVLLESFPIIVIGNQLRRY